MSQSKRPARSTRRTLAQSAEGLVAFQGARGAFSEEAARKLLGQNVEVLPCERFEDVFRSLKEGRTAGAIIPIENTLAGSVHENYDHLQNFELPIVAETNVRIVHNLIAPRGVSFSRLKRAFSHPVALNQCLDFFAQNPQIERIPFYDTAGSVKMVMEDRPAGAAAIASELAAKLYGGRILKREIEDDRKNFTRFFLLEPAGAKPRAARGRPWKTSLVFSTGNKPGSLFRALSALALRDLSLMKIESRPRRGKPWEYMFYLDLMGHRDEKTVRNALGHLAEMADFLRVLGSYRAAR